MAIYNYFLLVLIVVTVCIIVTAQRHEHHHSHDHDHDNEPGHFKYSKEANQPSMHHDQEHDMGSSNHGHNNGHSKLQFDQNGLLAFMNDPATNIWVYSIGSTFIISAVPYFILFFIPIQANTERHEPFLRILLSFASGGLLGDAFLHLIPHALMAHGMKETESGHHSHSHSHSHARAEHPPHDMHVGIWVLSGLITFLIVEKLVRVARGEGSHSHSHGNKQNCQKKGESESEGISVRKRKRSDRSEETDVVEKEEETKDKSSSKHEMKVAGYLNLAADFAHNFTDGLAIGASFLAGTAIGAVTVLTVLLHEIPHEIGDFAILIQSGCTKRRAMMLQLLTAVGALLGCFVSLWTSDPSGLADAAAASWVLPFTAGGFIYVATVSVIPELLKDSDFWQSVKQIMAIFVGIFMMVFIAWLE